MKPWMVYGAYGYTGELIVEEALRRGMRPVLGGRSEEKVSRMAQALGLEQRVFGLDRPEEVNRGLEDMALVVNCAGPFSRTAHAMSEGCLRQKVHYTDITGEIDVFEAMAAKDARAREA